jgi:mono/diheme cytochrome c family protein
LNIKTIIKHSPILLTILVVLPSCGSSKSKSTNVSAYSGESILVDYGEYVYEREKCSDCHTQQISQANDSIYSLDDYGGTRSPSWTFLFLEEPRFLFPGAKMPSFKNLKELELNRAVVEEILKNNSQHDINFAWNQLNTKVLDYKNNFNDLSDYSELKPSEIIPLVAYLQQIPRSPEKRHLDSLDNIELRKEMLAIEVLYEKSDSIISATLNDPSSIVNGKQLFNANCSVCHGTNAQGEIGPNLTDDYWIYGGDNEDIIRTIINGRPNGMPSHKYKFTPKEIGQVASYVMSLKGSNPAYPKDPQGTREK